ncbi:glycine zipper 2TM domain-containing protein [Comamonas piscis]
MPLLLSSRFLVLAALSALAAASPSAWAQTYTPSSDPFLPQQAPGAQPPLPAGEQPYGRVLSVTPAYRQVNTPQTVCNDQQVYAGQRTSGVGAITGAVVGGLLGNGVGHGFGRAAATGVGVIAGSAIGNQLEGGTPSYQTVRQCANQYTTQNQPDGYNVEYEYAGRRYSTRTATAPGEWLPLSVQPAAAYDNPPPQDYANTMPEPGVVVSSQPVYQQPVYMAPPPVYVAPAPVYYAPPPVMLQPSIQIGVGGYWGGHRGHWR